MELKNSIERLFCELLAAFLVGPIAPNMVFQRRVDGSVDFNRNWISYKGGFGDVSHEFWLGNDKLYHLTNKGNYQLRIDFVSRDGDPFYAKFDRFRINNESDNYRLSKIGEYSGNAGGAGGLKNRLNYSFSTSDKNNGGCSDDYHCGWWFRVNVTFLNGDYHAALNVSQVYPGIHVWFL
ncbi:hypothetical protein BSL78_16135 [Apostichopus japonicus]|uniref:Fibrinogen C-terminal domain-containing protein n=1 Tax=Stichopus japonicus TaxID=307972 RepID=A0A2G8KG78_STIJA|nr:hypothetical protein BSL78_16135 [Apostichopus japonicus]